MEKKIHKSLKKKLSIGAMVIIGIIVILILPIWNITQIEVKNNHWYTPDEIVKMSALQDKNILKVSLKDVKAQLLQLPYIKDAEIKYCFPGKILIKLSERKPLGYVPFMGTYLCIDEQGQVISQEAKKNLPLPVIQGLRFNAFKIGQVLPIENEDQLLCGSEIIQTLEKYKYETKVKAVDIYNLEQIHLYVDNLDVIIGNIGDFDKKLQWLMQAHEAYDMGILDLSNIKKGQAILSPIT